MHTEKHTMAYELPTNLIQQVKAATRAEAGLSDYDPTHDPPPLPSLSEAVASFDPSPPYLRCKNCKGRLLRDVQSVICIYCGRQNDVPPEPISFKDTFAYRWLLESLHLDGSEMVGLTTEKSESNKGQRAPKNEIPLSDFLNVKLTWPTESEKKEVEMNKKIQERSSLHLTGVDLDEFFLGSETLNASDTPEEHSFRSKHVEVVEAKEAATHNNLSFFENVQPSETTIQSSESKFVVEAAEAKEATTRDDFNVFQNVEPANLAAHISKDNDDDAFSGWEAAFQSANSGHQLDGSTTFDPFVTSVSSGNQHESSMLSDPFSGSKVDLSSQLDLVFGPQEGLKDGKTKDGTSAPSMGDWNDDLWNSLGSNVSQQTGQSDSTVGVKDAIPQDTQGFDWFGDDQWQSKNVNAPFSSMKHNNENSFIDLNDLTSSTTTSAASGNFVAQSRNQPIAASGETSELNLFSTDDRFEEMDFGSFSQADPLPGLSSKENVSSAMADIRFDFSSSERAVDTESDTSRWPGRPARDGDGDGNTAGTQEREEVERMVSQMHDLSFMLEENLSVPQKSNNLQS